MYDLGDRLLMVASDRISTYDVVHPTPIPDKGSGAHRAVRLLVRADRAHRPQPLISSTDGRARRRPRARRWPCSKLRDAAGRVRGARLPHRLGLEGLPGARARSRHRAAGRPARVRALPEPIFTPSTKADGRPRRDHRLRPRRRARRRPRPRRARARRVARDLPAGLPSTPRERGIILADTKFEFGLDADGELILGDEVLTPDSSRFWPADGYEPGQRPAELRQAVRARLGRPARAGTRRRRRRRSPTRSCEGTRGALRRGLRAHHRRAVRRLAGEDRRA